MRIYPAIKARMGDWNYFIVRMKMREIAHEVDLAHDIYEDKTLSDAVQRTLGENRVKKEIVGYLARREDRFFSSIVVAAMDGEPSWCPVGDNILPDIFPKSKSLQDSFGILAFGDDPKYYALDGQHRVAAIKLLANGEAEMNPPAGFDDDFLSVIVVLREDHAVSENEWLRRYRKLFSSLNRYAKPTDRDTNIIMDEDDLFAILTRRLITDHEFFRAPGREKDSFKVKTKGKNLRSDASHFTTLQTLYDMNETLLATPTCENINKQIRPEEDCIDDAYKELAAYWDAILEALPDLKQDPAHMRRHSRDPWDDAVDREGGPRGQDGIAHAIHMLKRGKGEREQDHLVFWPIGQDIFARLARSLLDKNFPGNGHASVERMKSALEPLAHISWELRGPPYRHLLRVSIGGSWRMRNEDRKSALQVAERILRWILHLDDLDDEGIAQLRSDWEELLYHDEPIEEEERNAMWQEVVNMRSRTACSPKCG